MGETKVETQRPPSNAPATGKPKSRLVRWLLRIAGVVVLLAAIAAGAAAYLLQRAAPMLRASLIETLEKQFHGRVELDDLRVAILNGFWVEGTGLRVWLPGPSPDQAPAQSGGANQAPWQAQPWILVGKLRFHVSSRILPGRPIEVSVFHVEDVRVLLPPKEDRPRLSLSGANGGAATPQSNSAQLAAAPPQPPPSASLLRLPRIEIRRIECQDAQLVMERAPEPGKPPKTPLDFEFHKIALTPQGSGGPVAFSVDMVNAKPVGTIHTTGQLGPLASWNPRDPGSLPVQGAYTFDHADLSTIKGIAGILSSTGRYAGTLRRMEADGETETPDFRLERVARYSGVPLTTHFHAVVDGTNGDTWLQPVDAMLGHTHIVAQGEVVRASESDPGRHGHDIQLQVTVDRGRIEDLLRISADAEKPFVTGNLTFQTSFRLPPNPPSGPASLWDRLGLDGQFHLSQARFGNAAMQGKIEQLSLRGQGKPKELKSSDPTSILSDAEGHFRLAEGQLQLPDLTYRVPGATILAHGTYGLAGGALSFEGDAKMDASLSQMVGGWKGVLLKPVDRYLRKNGAGTDVPIHISGTRKAPSFGVDFDRLGKNTEPKRPQ